MGLLDIPSKMVHILSFIVLQSLIFVWHVVVDGDPSKGWYVNANRGWIRLESSEELMVGRYSIIVGENYPGYDPMSWILQGIHKRAPLS